MEIGEYIEEHRQIRGDGCVIELTMLGTGCAFSKKYYNNNALFALNGYRLLVDCGKTAHRSLFELGMSWEQDLDGVLITHLHSDHIGGLEEIALDGKYKYGKKIDLYVPHVLLNPLWENCLKGGVADPVHNSLADFFNVHVQTDERFRIRDVDLRFMKTEHVTGKDSFSLRVGNVFYSSDARFDEDLILSLPDGVSHIFHDCSITPSPVHASVEQLTGLPDHVRRKVWIMHYTDELPHYLEMHDLGPMNILEQHRKYVLAP